MADSLLPFTLLESDFAAPIRGERIEECNARLAGLGCDLVQGYLFGRPMPAEEIAGVAGRRTL